jgi:16S rRNA (guanine1207-N2)-methyltransferase
MDVPRMFSGPVQLLGRSLEAAAPRRPWIVLPSEAGLPSLFSGDLPEARYHYADFALYRADRASAPAGRLHFGHRLEPGEEPGDFAALFFPKEKALAAYFLAETARALAPGSPLFVVGPNRGGIRSARRLVEPIAGPVTGSAAARHSVLLRVRVDRSPESPDLRRRFTFSMWGREVRVVSRPGVFSHGALDPGSRFLLECLGEPAFRRALDWGCGAGAVGAALALARPEAVVDLLDSDAMAVASARETLQANGLDPGRVFPSDGFSEVRGSYDLIAANPPFHAGLRTDLAATERMLGGSARHLVEGGRLVFVANAHHDFREALHRRFPRVRELGANGRFRVMEAS